MSEITKLYENAEIEKKKMCEWLCADEITCINWCEYYGDKTLYYPPFTAEKQLDLFKLLIRHPKTEVYCRYTNDKYKLIMYTEDCCTSDIGSFENVLASVVCNVWGLLSLEEKQQIKGILE